GMGISPSTDRSPIACLTIYIGILNLYPNPAKDEIILNYSGRKNEMHLEIYDALGIIIYETKPKDDTHGSVKINSSQFHPGAYTVKLTEVTTGGFLTRKIIKE
ncbi:MAG: T9SS type A sorting domain-containing protein, partial [Bacteroidia bacterium]